MSNFFQFEADFVESLRCIPMQVRFKLDTCGIKLKLQQWHRLNHEQRQQLVELPCSTPVEIQAYRNFLQDLILETTGEPATELPIEADPDWMNEANIPELVANKAKDEGITLTLDQWAKLTLLQRFVLIKLSRSSHENKNFVPAFREFQENFAQKPSQLR